MKTQLRTMQVEVVFTCSEGEAEGRVEALLVDFPRELLVVRDAHETDDTSLRIQALCGRALSGGRDRGSLVATIEAIAKLATRSTAS